MLDALSREIRALKRQAEELGDRCTEMAEKVAREVERRKGVKRREGTRETETRTSEEDSPGDEERGEQGQRRRSRGIYDE